MCPFHAVKLWIIELTAQLKNRFMMGADGRTPTARRKLRGSQRPVHERGEKVLFLPLTPPTLLSRDVRLRDLPGLQIT